LLREQYYAITYNKLQVFFNIFYINLIK
jgi:hypothetical protein